MDNWLNYHHLYYFMVIATEGSIAKASKKLLLGQPTLSAQLKQLEENLGVTLFEREHKCLTLTETGKMTLDYAREIFRLGDEMKGLLSERLVLSKIPLTIGILDGVSKNIASVLIEKALNFAPCTLASLEGRLDYLVRELLSYKVDLILTNHRPNFLEGAKIKSRMVMSSPVIISGTEEYLHLKKDFPKSLHKARMVLPTAHSGFRRDLDHFFELKKVRPDIVAVVEDMSLQNLLGEKGLGLVAMSEVAFNLKKSKKLKIIGKIDTIRFELFLLSAPRRIENPVASYLFNNFSL